jgi:hypothetical protein
MKIFMQTVYGDDYLHGEHIISKMNYNGFIKSNRGFTDILRFGINRSSLYSRLTDPGYLHQLFITGDSGYHSYLNEFKERFKDYDVIVMNPGVDLVHPEYLIKNFPNALKIMHFIDDPHLTYSYGTPYSWAFDAATYISPSYSVDYTMGNILKLIGFKNSKWIPHCVTNTEESIWKTDEELILNLNKRIPKAIYVGNYYKGKIDRLMHLKKKLGSQFEIYGNYHFFGLEHTWKLLNRHKSLYLIKQLTEHQKNQKYLTYAIGINLHLSDPAIETGNARLYELPYHGVAQIADCSNISKINEIYTDKKEILLYNNIQECIELTEWLLNSTNERVNIAYNAYIKTKEKYTMPIVIEELIKWFEQILSVKNNSKKI